MKVWMLYIISIITISVLFSGFFINMTLKNLKGPQGQRGEIGDTGEKGDTGICEANCRNNIAITIIMKAINRRLTELEEERKSGKTISENDKKIIDYIVYYDNINKTHKEILDKLNEKLTEGKIEKNENLMNIDFIKETVQDKSLDEEYVKTTNIYIKEKVKSMANSDEFKELSPFRGPQKLIEYLKDIWILWVELIYNAGGGAKYFTTLGAENDFEWLEENPFDEIKKYDVYYWGMSDKAKPRAIPVKEKYTKKMELEGFRGFGGLSSQIAEKILKKKKNKKNNYNNN